MAISTEIKRFIYPLYILPKISIFKKIKYHKLFEEIKKNNSQFSYKDIKIKNFSTREEDGIILFLIAKLNIKKGYFLDIGSNDCINSNFANLVFHFDWDGIFIDADLRLLNIGKRVYKLYKPKRDLKFIESFITPKNINDLIDKNKTRAEIDFMNIDIDGNDYEIWKSIEVVKPKIVVIENKIEYGKNEIIILQSEKHNPENWGASLYSFNLLAKIKDYELVATIQEGFNAFFVRKDLIEEFKIPILDIDTVLNEVDIKKSFYSISTINQLKQSDPLL